MFFEGIRYPIPIAPYVDIAVERAFRLQLMQSALHNCEEAIAVLYESDEGRKAYQEAKEFVEKHKAETAQKLGVPDLFDGSFLRYLIFFLMFPPLICITELHYLLHPRKKLKLGSDTAKRMD